MGEGTGEGELLARGRDPVLAAVVEVERHVADGGWDQPTRLFALVPTRDLVDAQPHLAAALDVDALDGRSLTPVEQEDLPQHDSLEALLAQIGWPDEVTGSAVVVERVMLPAEVEPLLPPDEQEALRFLAEHPQRQEMRLAVAALRDGRRACALRFRAHDEDTSVLVGRDLAPGLVQALAATLDT